jgi:hypothetical protein
MKLIDSDILIDHFHGHQAALTFISQQLPDITVITPYERGR